MKHISAAAELLDREIPADYLPEWADILAAEQKSAETKLKSILVFRIASEWLGLSTVMVDEVTDVGVIRRLPHRGGTLVQGIVSLRGEVLVCVALDVLLGLKRPKDGRTEDSRATHSRLIVCKTYGGRLAFVASEVHGVERYVPRELRQVPATVSQSSHTYTTGILPWKGHQTIGYLDSDLLFRALDKGLS
ncbi:MAG: chemotaxis protein CheW [Candidatus Acidiferrales bacterium]